MAGFSSKNKAELPKDRPSMNSVFCFFHHRSYFAYVKITIERRLWHYRYRDFTVISLDVNNFKTRKEMENG